MEENFGRACTILGLEELKRLLRPSIESTPTRRPLRIGGESGVEYIHRLLNAHPDFSREQLRLYIDDIVRPHKYLSLVPPEIMNNLFLWPFFEDCVGALYGTHIQAIISDNEGSVHDITVWVDSLTQSKYSFPHPPAGIYYLVDSGYPNTMGYLSPIKDPNVRYHIPYFKKKRVFRGMSEQFNYRHSSLRTTVERAFSNLKKRWKILDMMPQMEDIYQVYVIVATFTLHNFIRRCKLGILVSEHDVNVQDRVDSDMLNPARKEVMNKVHKKITLRLWRSISGNIWLEVAALQQEENIEPETTCNKKNK
ncbi:hypothetical protein OROMI_022841 [Orobanche minor]